MNLGNVFIGRLSAHLQDLEYSDYFSDFLLCSLQDTEMSARTDVCIW